ncbi:hypothetical protein [Ammoniphilus sp. 3BR4]
MKRSNIQFIENEIIHLRQMIGEWVEQKELRGVCEKGIVMVRRDIE